MSSTPLDPARGKRILHVRRDVMGLRSQEEFAKALGAGITRGAVGNWERGGGIASENLVRIAEVSGVRLEWLASERGAVLDDQADKRRPSPDTFKPKIIPGSELVSSETMPVYAAAQGGDGHLVVAFDEVDRVKRPSALQSVKGGYGLLVTGESMIPAFRPGETALVHPHLPPMRDTDVILYHVPPHNEAEAMIKRLIGFNDQQWTLEQYNPYLKFKEYRQEWQTCHRVVGKYSAR